MTREDRTRVYLIMAHLGGLATIAVLSSFALDLPDFIKGLSLGLMVVPLVVMLLSKYRDEYIETLWQAGTSLSFAALVICFLGLPFLEGFYDGVIGSERGQDIPAEFAGFAAIIAFYTGFHFRWLRGLK